MAIRYVERLPHETSSTILLEFTIKEVAEALVCYLKFDGTPHGTLPRATGLQKRQRQKRDSGNSYKFTDEGLEETFLWFKSPMEGLISCLSTLTWLLFWGKNVPKCANVFFKPRADFRSL
eukprot:GHVN01037715.1.p1 GENE.GHVN01037715.1~~GHVN01037715.1.p1  ORF type:complete len:120 (+),score=12.50 GHVN01037715.1:1012-1371(+)